LERGTSETPGFPSQAQSNPGHPFLNPTICYYNLRARAKRAVLHIWKAVTFESASKTASAATDRATKIRSPIVELRIWFDESRRLT